MCVCVCVCVCVCSEGGGGDQVEWADFTYLGELGNNRIAGKEHIGTGEDRRKCDADQ